VAAVSRGRDSNASRSPKAGIRGRLSNSVSTPQEFPNSAKSRQGESAPNGNSQGKQAALPARFRNFCERERELGKSWRGTAVERQKDRVFALGWQPIGIRTASVR
jgi:hypothetical protein